MAKHIGVLGAIQPCTNPIVTPMANAMAALKGRNTIIIPEEIYDDVIDELKFKGGYVVKNQKEREPLLDVLFPG